jgi:hypothetical protein
MKNGYEKHLDKSLGRRRFEGETPADRIGRRI